MMGHLLMLTLLLGAKTAAPSWVMCVQAMCVQAMHPQAHLLSWTPGSASRVDCNTSAAAGAPTSLRGCALA
jgi:hypothetical protein